MKANDVTPACAVIRAGSGGALRRLAVAMAVAYFLAANYYGRLCFRLGVVA